jgi:hypothetical protein
MHKQSLCSVRSATLGEVAIGHRGGLRATIRRLLPKPPYKPTGGAQLARSRDMADFRVTKIDQMVNGKCADPLIGGSDIPSASRNRTEHEHMRNAKSIERAQQWMARPRGSDDNTVNAACSYQAGYNVVDVLGQDVLSDQRRVIVFERPTNAAATNQRKYRVQQIRDY